MNTLREAIEDYVRLRRDLGFKLTQTERLLHDFASFMENQKAPFITTERALEWASRPAHTHPSYWAKQRHGSSNRGSSKRAAALISQGGPNRICIPHRTLID